MQRLWINAYALFDIKNAVIKIEDGADPANTLTVKIGEGTIGWTERKERRYILDRGVLDSVRNEDETPLEVKLDFMWEYIKGGLGSEDPPTIEEALKQTGNAADWTSSDDDTCQPYAVNLVIYYTPTPSACGDKETITIADFRYEQIEYDARNSDTVSITGRANVTEPTVVREAQTS